MIVCVLFIAGDQLPAMPLLDVAGRLKLPPEQIGETCVKLGVWVGLMVKTTGVLVALRQPVTGSKASAK